MEYILESKSWVTTKKEMVKLQDKYAASRKTNLAGLWKKKSIRANKLNPRPRKWNGIFKFIIYLF